MSLNDGILALMVTFIGLSGLLAGRLSRYSLSAEALLTIFPPPLCPKQAVVDKANNAAKVIIPSNFTLFFM
jgi:hypothetical protein